MSLLFVETDFHIAHDEVFLPDCVRVVSVFCDRVVKIPGVYNSITNIYRHISTYTQAPYTEILQIHMEM